MSGMRFCTAVAPSMRRYEWPWPRTYLTRMFNICTPCEKMSTRWPSRFHCGSISCSTSSLADLRKSPYSGSASGDTSFPKRSKSG